MNGRSTHWWLASILSLLGFAGLAFLIGLQTRDNWGAAVLLLGVLYIGAFICVLLAAISFAKRETRRTWASIAALPCLGFLIWGLPGIARDAYRQWQSDLDFRVYSASLDQLKANPEIALQEHWPATRTTPQSRAFFDAVWAPYVQFSAGQLERIYADLPDFREVVFRQPACTPEFIAVHFPEALNRAQRDSPRMLEYIVQHPHTPLPLVQRVVFSRKQLPFEPPYQAGLNLQIRKSEVPDDPREILRPYERNAERKFFVLTLQGRDFRTLEGGNRRFSNEVNSYVPGVSPDFELVSHGDDEVVFLPGLYNENRPTAVQQLHLAEAFALEHNQSVLRLKGGEHSSP